jgi:hypothetical protein
LTKIELLTQYIKEHPGQSTNEIYRQTGISKRHIRRVRTELKDVEYKQLPKILLLDIETIPMEVLVWGLYKQRISPQQIVKDWSILCWCAKWLGDEEIFGGHITGKDAINRDDRAVLPSLHAAMNDADIIIAHNAQAFDIPKIYGRFLINQFPPITPFKVVDTLLVARKHFSLSSNTLDEVARVTGCQRKIHTDYDLWYNSAVHGDEEAINNLFQYCKQDIVVLEEVYLKLRPWIKSHPNLNLYTDTVGAVCSNCGSDDLEWKGFYYTTVGKYQSYTCNSCGAIGRSRKTELEKEKLQSLVVPTAR